MTYQSSRYNFAIPVDNGTLIYSAKTGAANLLQGRDGERLASALCGKPRTFESDRVDDALLEQLVQGGFLSKDGDDELLEIRHRYLAARRETPLVITVTTTMDCNLGCYYCYEERTTDRLELADLPRVIAHIEHRLTQSNSSSLHVDWYGGEPLLNIAFLEEASCAIQGICHARSVRYSASVISNGTMWPSGIESFVRRHAIRQVQVSFDGLRANHNRRRRYRDGQHEGNSSFDIVVRLVDELVCLVQVDLRINIDRGNVQDVQPLLTMMHERGWFSAKFPATVQPARLAAYSERSAFMRDWELSCDEYDELRQLVRNTIGDLAKVEESEAPDGYPRPRSSVCAALAFHSDVIGADGFTYRCGLQVGERQRRIQRASEDSFAKVSELPILTKDDVEVGQDRRFWEEFDPTRQPNCSRCSFLPVCWGGCPKKHLEGDSHALAEQGRYWRLNLARLVTSNLAVKLKRAVEFTENDQFR